MRRASWWAAFATALVCLLDVSAALAVGRDPVDAAAAARLKAEKGAGTLVSFNSATGAARVVSLARDSQADLSPGAAGASLDERSRAFFRSYGSVFGIRDAASELAFVRSWSDSVGTSHASYVQRYQGVPVFGAVMHTHFDAAGRLRTVNGGFVPQIDVDVTPRRALPDLETSAVNHVQRKLGPEAGELSARGAVLYVYREGLVRGIPGRDHLVYEVEVVGTRGTRELVYVDAHNGKVVDQITGNETALFRRSFDGANSASEPGPNYPSSPFWVEGDSFPTGTTEADNMISASAELFNILENAFDFDDNFTFFPNTSGEMHSIFNRGWGCPNASWQGTYISFCPGFTTDDVTGHEWSHAITDFTHNLIYMWQSGALNESYSDIWGETLDQINGRQTDSPGGLRTDGACSTFFGSPLPSLTVTSPASIAGTYSGTATVNEPPRPATATGAMVVASPADSCSVPTNVSGKIAIIDWAGGTCGSVTKTTNAFNGGALGAIIVADPSGLIGLTGSASILTIQVPNDTGALLKANLPGNATIDLAAGTDASYRWIMGEDVTGGAIRDMWNPNCFGDPGKVSDEFLYVCDGNFDGGGVHINSGIPNHGFALLVDGGTYNGQTITGIGGTKAANIYFRAQSVYQTPTSNFIDHADALELSCQDLLGQTFEDLSTGTPAGTFTSALSTTDCDQVTKMIAAVELRMEPDFCGFTPLLAKNPPPLCGGGATLGIFNDDFESGFASEGWTVSHVGVNGSFTPRDWVELAGYTLGGRTSSMAFGTDPMIGDCGANNEAGVINLDSPVIGPLPAGVAPFAVFDHYVATETGWDGGNLQINVNSGGWQNVASGDFLYNPYNGSVISASNGNDDPLAGEEAFTGADGGANGGSWGQSQLNLAPYATDGDTIQLRFRVGTDGCSGVDGWYVDNVVVDSCVAAGMISPTPGTTLASNVVTFTWSTGQGVSQYWLQVGNTKPGSGQFFNAALSGTSQQVGGLPVDGKPVYVRLWSLIAGQWYKIDYTYTAIIPVPSKITTPLPGTQLSSSSVTFNWNAGATANHLQVGDQGPGSKNIFDAPVATAAPGHAPSQTVSGLPTDARQVWVRLWSLVAGKWVFVDYYYVATGTAGCLFGGAEQITNPSFSSGYSGWNAFSNAIGAPFYSAPFAIFGCWTSGGAPFRELAFVEQDLTIPQGAAELGFYLYWYDTTTNAPEDYFTVTIDDQPLFSAFGGNALADWVTEPSFAGVDLKFVNVTPFADGGDHTLRFEGNTSGANTGFDAFGCGSTYFLAFPSLQTCSPVSEILTPTPSTTLSASSSQTFTWSPGIGVTANYLQIGTVFKGSSLFNAPVSGGTQTVTGLPTDGGPLWVRLWSRIAGKWYKLDYSYTTADGRAMITTPAVPGPLNDATTFNWDPKAATGLWFQVGTVKPGSGDVFNSAVTGTSQAVDLSGVTSATTVYVRLWSFIGGKWFRIDYTYTKA